MNFFIYITLLLILILVINGQFIKNNFLVNETGDKHQKFATNLKIPLTGGIFLFLGILYFFNQNFKSFILFSFLILILGIFSDLKFIHSALKRFLYQITLVLCFVIFNNIQILDTRVLLLDNLLYYDFFNYLFVSFCILIVVYGSNFLDGLNTLNIGYYLLITLVIYYLSLDNQIFLNNIEITHFLILFFFVFILNLFNRLYLGDSGSYLLGFIFSVFLIHLYNTNANISPFFVTLLLWYPCYETLFSILRKRILNKSAMDPDTNHLHQLIFFFIKNYFKIKVFYANIITANLINTYNLLIFLFALSFVSNSQIQLMLILLNLIIYTVIYFKVFIFKNTRK